MPAAPVGNERSDRSGPSAWCRLPGTPPIMSPSSSGAVCFCGDLVLGEGSTIVPPAAGGGSLVDYMALARAAGRARREAALPRPRPLDHRAGGEDRRVRRAPARARAPAARGARRRQALRPATCSTSPGPTSPSSMRPAAALAMRAHLEKLDGRGSAPARGSILSSHARSTRSHKAAADGLPARPDQAHARGAARAARRGARRDRDHDRAARLAALDAALVRRPRRRHLGVDVRQVPEGQEPRARQPLHAAGRDRRTSTRSCAAIQIEAETEIDPRHRRGPRVRQGADRSATPRGSTRSRAMPRRRCEAQAPKRVAIHFNPVRTATWDHRKLGGTY